MAINEWKIWQKLGISKVKKEVVNVDKDFDAVLASLNEYSPLMKNLSGFVIALKALRKKEVELSVKGAPDAQLRIVVQEQVKIFDQLLKLYEFFEMDVDISGARIKKVSKVLGQKAIDLNVDQKYIDKIKKSERWTFNW